MRVDEIHVGTALGEKLLEFPVGQAVYQRTASKNASGGKRNLVNADGTSTDGSIDDAASSSHHHHRAAIRQRTSAGHKGLSARGTGRGVQDHPSRRRCAYVDCGSSSLEAAITRSFARSVVILAAGALVAGIGVIPVSAASAATATVTTSSPSGVKPGKDVKYDAVMQELAIRWDAATRVMKGSITVGDHLAGLIAPLIGSQDPADIGLLAFYKNDAARQVAAVADFRTGFTKEIAALDKLGVRALKYVEGDRDRKTVKEQFAVLHRVYEFWLIVTLCPDFEKGFQSLVDESPEGWYRSRDLAQNSLADAVDAARDAHTKLAAIQK
jgi:hypothetical protein